MSGLLFLLAVQFNTSPNTSVAIIIAGRALFGGAESFIVTGALSWGLAIGGPKNAGKVMAWIGTAMYVAIAAGAPIGTFIYSEYGFLSIALLTSLISLVVLLWVSAQHFVVSPAEARPSIMKVINAVAMPGIGLAFSSIGFAAISTFIVLLFSQHGWNLGWLAVTVFAVAFVLARIFLSGLADQVGGSKVAFLSALIEAFGLGLIWFAPSEVLALVGATITGFGYSLVYPGLGVEALHRSPAESRGLAMGAYTAFLDLALGIANPVLGLLATTLGIRGVFLSSAILVMFSSLVSLRLMISNRSST
jgi:MFS family permease